jgi:DHA3 family macrolide efflux protein-like MFS transporter
MTIPSPEASIPTTENTNWKRPFFTVWIGQAFSLLGSSVVGFALVWYLTQQTGSATILATATLVNLIPGVFLGPFAGALVDRWNRKRVMVVADATVALLTGLLALLFWSGYVQLWHIFVIMFLRSLAGTFHYPAMSASTSLMVPKEQLARVAGMNQTLNGAMSIVSPPLGAFLLAALPIYGVIAVDVVTAAIAVGLLLLITIPQPQTALSVETITPASLLRDVRDGFRYLYKWTGMMIIGASAALINFLFFPAFTFMPLLVIRHFNGGAWELGFIQAAWGVGVITGGITLSVWGGFKKRILTALMGVAGMGVGTLIISLCPPSAYWLAVVGMFLAGFANPIANGPLFAIFQAKIAPEMQGRIFTLIGSVANAMSPLSMVVGAPVANLLGERAWFALAGVGAILMSAFMYSNRHVRKVEEENAPS